MLDRDSMNTISAGFLDQDLMNINNDTCCSCYCNCCCCFNHNHDQLPSSVPVPLPPLHGIISVSVSASSLENGANHHHQIQIMNKGKKKQVKKCINGVKKKKKMKMVELDSSKEYVHVRARRGQATDSHSLAERVRRAKISGRMKQLQDLVPGCDKVIGKAVMLEEIINYIQFLQHQVEFLSMKLAYFNPMFYNMEPFIEGITSSLMPNTQQYCNENIPSYFGDHNSTTNTTFTNNQIMDNHVLMWDDMDHDSTANNNLYPFQ